MEVDVFFDPPDVDAGGARGVMFESNGITLLVEEFLPLRPFGMLRDG